MSLFSETGAGTEPPSNELTITGDGYKKPMHPAARIFLGLFALWTLLKIPLFVTVAEQTRRHLGEAPAEIRKPLRSRMIGSYGAALLNVTILVVVGAIVISGSTAFIKDFVAPLMAVFVVGLVAGAIGIKGTFDSLHNPPVDDFYRRYGVENSAFLRRARSRRRRTD